MELIDKNELRTEALRLTGESEFAFDNCFPYWQFSKCIKEAPTVDAVEVVHAHWINSSSRKHGNLDPEFRCSNCEEIYWYFGVESFEFCPKCGAKMDGRKKDVM